MKATSMSDNVEISPDVEVGSSAPMAILRTFVLNSKTPVLSGLVALSYIAGREGDDEWEWAAEAEDALIDAFFATPLPPNTVHPRSERFNTAKAILAGAYRGGRAQREIDLAVVGQPGTMLAQYSQRQVEGAAVCERAMSVAHAHATLYASEVEFPMDCHPHAIESEIGYVAAKLAQRHPLNDAEAAYCALRAFEERGFDITYEAAANAMERAAVGRADREAEEEKARERAADIASATAGLFGGAE
jgi:hypothetical protein